FQSPQGFQVIQLVLDRKPHSVEIGSKSHQNFLIDAHSPSVVAPVSLAVWRFAPTNHRKTHQFLLILGFRFFASIHLHFDREAYYNAS
ncbi:MAG: hypothetical protein ACM37W_20945, partial [Actinomycetota bacterium]